MLKMEEKLFSKVSSRNKEKEFKNLVTRQLDHQFYQVSGKNQTEKQSHMLEPFPEEMRIYTGDYISVKRTLRFLISRNRECSMLVNDTVLYTKLANVNFIEHMILHNNGETIDPIGVYSDKVNISFFAFNR